MHHRQAASEILLLVIISALADTLIVQIQKVEQRNTHWEQHTPQNVPMLPIANRLYIIVTPVLLF